MSLSVGLIYVATSVFGLCGALLCVSVIALVVRQQGPPPVRPFQSPVPESRFQPFGQVANARPLSLVESGQGTIGMGPPVARDAAAIKAELSATLRKVETLKAELTALDSLNAVVAKRITAKQGGGI